MAKFIYKMQSLLNIKAQMEDNMKNELGKAVRKLEFEKGILKSIEDDRGKYINRFNSESGRGIQVEKLKKYTEYISHLNDKIGRQKENINFAKKSVDNYRELLIKVVRERKILEKLKEKRYQDFVKQQLKEEQRLTDEVVSYNYINKPVEEKNG